MTISLRLISGEDEDFLREIEISGNATFLDLHVFIQQLLHFDEGQMASFFITDDDWQKNKEITLFDMAMDESGDSFVMSDTKLKDLIAQNKQRLLYVFDFFNERNIFIEVFDISEENCNEPQCIRATGDAPEQIDLNDLLGESTDMYAPLDTSNHKNDLLGYADDDFDFDDEFNMDDDSLISYTDELEDF